MYLSSASAHTHSTTNRVVLNFARLYYGSREITESLTCTTGDAIKLSVGYFSPSRIISRLELIRRKDVAFIVEGNEGTLIIIWIVILANGIV